jgi:hypothetical protein
LSKVLAQEETLSFPPLLVFDNAILCREDEEEMNNNVSNPSCYDTDNDIDDNIDEFIHVGRRWRDAISYDVDLYARDFCCLNDPKSIPILTCYLKNVMFLFDVIRHYFLLIFLCKYNRCFV